MRREEVHIWFWWGNVMERDHSEDLGVDERVILYSNKIHPVVR
jgi:hypothetical protein